MLSAMIILGFWAVRNVCRIGRSMLLTNKESQGAITVGRSSAIHPKDRQLIQMLI